MKKMLRTALHIGLSALLAGGVAVGTPAAVSAGPGTTFNVDSTSDGPDIAPGDGECFSDQGDCTLRAAIMEANAQASADLVTIVLQPGTYRLFGGRDEDNAVTGDLDINSNVAIVGAGGNTYGPPSQTIIDANGLDRVFDLNANLDDNGYNIALQALTVQNGMAGDLMDSIGGGIRGDTGNRGTITLQNIVVQDNAAPDSNPGDGWGGGVYISGLPGGTLSVDQAVIRRNSAYARGGGLQADGDMNVSIRRSSIEANAISGSASAYGAGLALFPQGQGARSVALSELTLSGNTALSGSGGGAYIAVPAAISNTTVSGNSAQSGGGLTISNAFGSSTLTHLTLSANTGGGLYQNGGGAAQLHNSIVAGNTGGDVTGGLPLLPSSDFNLIGTGGSGGLIQGTNGNLVGVADPGLLPLDNYGGFTNTHALKSGSPALDAGNIAYADATDQRGVNRVADSADGDTTAKPDIGAYEAVPDLAPIADQSIGSGLPLSVPILLGSATLTEALILTASSSDTGKVKNSAMSSFTGTGSSRTLQLQSEPGATGTVTITVRARGVQNGVPVSSSTAFRLTLLQTPDLKISSAHSGSFSPGQSGAYTLTVSNQGSGATSGTVTVTDTLPAGLTAAAISGNGWTCALGTLTCTRSDVLAAGASYPPITLTVNVANDAEASLVNQATVSGGGDSTPVNNTATDPTAVVRQADLSIVSTHSGAFRQGQSDAAYALTVANAGSAATSGTVTVTDTLPAGLTATAISGNGWICTLGTLTCTRSDALAAGDSYPPITLTIRVADTAGASLTNQANVSGGGDGSPANNTATDPTIVEQTPNLTVIGLHAGSLEQGQKNVSYNLTVSNIGSGSTNGSVTLQVTLPPGMTAVSLTSPWGACEVGTLSCTTTEEMQPNQGYAYTLVVDIAPDAAPSLTLRSEISGGGELASNLADNAFDSLLTIKQHMDLAIESAHAGPFEQGQTGAVYTLTVRNVGTGQSGGTVTVTDTLPVGLTATAMSGTGWSCDVGTLTCTRADGLDGGASYPPITLTASVAWDAPVNGINTATVSGGGEPPGGTNNQASDLTSVTDNSLDLRSLTLSAGSLSFSKDVTDYTVTVPNAVAQLTVTAEAVNAASTLSVDGSSITSGTASAPIPLAEGQTTDVTVSIRSTGTGQTQTYTIHVIRSLSSNADLTELRLSSGTLSPSFQPGTLSYSAVVPNGTLEVAVTPYVADSRATVTIQGTVAVSGQPFTVQLPVGALTINVMVTAQDGTTKHYEVRMTREASSDSRLRSMQLSGGTVQVDFDPTVLEYRVSVGYEVSAMTVTGTVYDAGATLTVGGVQTTVGLPSASVALTPGAETVIPVVVTAQNGVVKTTYLVRVQRAAGNNADLSGLTLSEGGLLPAWGPAVLEYEASVVNAVYSLTVTPVLADSAADLSIQGKPAANGQPFSVQLPVGVTDVPIVVTAADGVTRKTYQLTVKRAPSADVRLAGLQLSDGTLQPIFDEKESAYAAYVGYGVAQVTVTASVYQPDATVAVQGVAVASGQPSAPITLAPGADTPIQVVVTAQNSVDQMTYLIRVNRAPSSNAALSGLSLSAGALTPAFDPSVLAYTANVGYSVSRLTVTASVYDALASVTVAGNGVGNGAPSKELTLMVGQNVIPIVVTAQDGTTQTTYLLRVNRAAAPVSPPDNSNGSGTKDGTTEQPETKPGSILIDGIRVDGAVEVLRTPLEDGQLAVQVKLTDKLLQIVASLKDNAELVMAYTEPADKVSFQFGSQLLQKLNGKQLVIRTETAFGAYLLPISELSADRLLQELGEGAKLEDLQIALTLAVSPQETADRFQQAAAEAGGRTLLVSPIDYTITVTSGGRSAELHRFSGYVKRELLLPEGLNPDRIGTAVVLDADGRGLHPVPTVLIERDGRLVAVIRSLTNSSYSVIDRPAAAAFRDLDGHWSKVYVESLASRLILTGVEANRFAPEGQVTRAQLAAILVRTLGVGDAADAGAGSIGAAGGASAGSSSGTGENGGNANAGSGGGTGFRDVSLSDWFSGAVQQAAAYGIISGYEDGTFRPNATVTRQEAFVMVARALQAAGLGGTAVADAEAQQVLRGFSDGSAVQPWAAAATAQLVSAGLVTGSELGLQPGATLTRAEAATMVYQLMRQLVGN